MTIFKTMLITSLRDKITLFYSIIFPIGLLIGLGLYFDSEAYKPVLLTGVIALSSLFWGVSGIAFQVLWQRGRGVYKLLKLTPYPTVGFILHMAAARTFLGMAINLLIFLAGILFLNIDVPLNKIPAMLAVLAVGTWCFTCLGFFISNLANNEGQVNMISNIFFLPMIFGSNAFYSLDNAPEWLITAGKAFPLGYLVAGLRECMGIETGGSYFGALLSLLLFTAAFLLAAAVTFRWEAGDPLISRRKRIPKAAKSI